MSDWVVLGDQMINFAQVDSIENHEAGNITVVMKSGSRVDLARHKARTFLYFARAIDRRLAEEALTLAGSTHGDV